MKTSPLHRCHLALQARMVGFGGWEMPVQFTGLREEHQAVREAVGIFDISHMGNLTFSGPGAEAFLQRLLSNDVARLGLNQGQYSFLLNESGGVIDDLLLYREGPTTFYAVVNAAVLDTDLAWIADQLAAFQRDASPGDAVNEVQWGDESGATVGIAVQGPRAAALLERIMPGVPLPPRNGIVTCRFAGATCRVARTGYTGEDGFELFIAVHEGEALWEALRTAGAVPCGLGARDTLRLEAGLPLNGNDLRPDITPSQAGFGRFVALDKATPFIGQAALLAEQSAGPRRHLRAFRLGEKAAPPRSHYPLLAGDTVVGEVTSGIVSPTLGYGMGFALIEAPHAALGNELSLEVRGKRYPATLVQRPLYRRKSAGSHLVTAV